MSLNFLFYSRKFVALHFNGQRSHRKIFGAGIVCELSLCTFNGLVCVFAGCQHENRCDFAFDTLISNEKAVKRTLF